ncbi:unnamed protein product [Rotaria sordida]|uniref:Cytochrome P450 n=1 Tax=Rotaria sordida TaxID=392033 RepID=A0A814ISA9_9BILA|nr:unnamed protein product [Rotaria sordida]CAF1028177.1 unnamed protein product [Rotaria sordida]
MIPSYEHMNDLQVCEAILQETLRLYPPVPWFVRKCIREHTIGSDGHHQVRIPVGTTIAIMTYMLHRRADFWPRPLEFDYMRWMRNPMTGLKPKLTHPFCYLPFAAGSRNCIGQNFALLEAKVMLAMFVQRLVVPTLKLAIGWRHVDECPVNPRIPHYMVVAGRSDTSNSENTPTGSLWFSRIYPVSQILTHL